MNLRSILAALGVGVAVTLATLALFSYWWPYFWFPFTVATVILYGFCHMASSNPIATGLVTSLPGLLIPAFTWRLVLFMWEPVVQARQTGGLYRITCMGDPQEISTIGLFLILPAGLVLASGLTAGALAAVVKRRQKERPLFRSCRQWL